MDDANDSPGRNAQLTDIPLELLNPRSRQILREAAAAGKRNGDDYIGSEHILFGIVMAGAGPAWSILSNLGQLEPVRAELETLFRHVADERRSGK